MGSKIYIITMLSVFFSEYTDAKEQVKETQ